MLTIFHLSNFFAFCLIRKVLRQEKNCHKPCIVYSQHRDMLRSTSDTLNVVRKFLGIHCHTLSNERPALAQEKKSLHISFSADTRLFLDYHCSDGCNLPNNKYKILNRKSQLLKTAPRIFRISCN